jgi:outer membrane cobalamin receptor
VRRIERGTSANDSRPGVAGRTVGTAQEFGTDINGRVDLHALDQTIRFDAGGAHLATDTNVSVDAAHRTDAGFFGSVQVPVVRTVLFSAGIRGDRVTTENRGGFFGDRSTAQGASGTGRPFSPSAVLVHAQARSFRDPTLSDRYSRTSGRGFITGNPDLAAEKSIQFDSAARFTHGRYRVAVYLFHYRIEDLVERYEDAADFFFFRNRGQSRVRGIEMESQIDVGARTTIELSGQTMRGTAEDDGSGLDAIPQRSLSPACWQLGSRGFLRRAAQFTRATRVPGRPNA